MAGRDDVVKPKLIRSNKLRAIKILKETVDLLDKHKIIYHLEGGTLLGFVRDNDILPWDYDVDISINADEVEKFLLLSSQFKKIGYKIRKKGFGMSMPPLKKGEYRIFKVKPLGMSILKEIIPWFKKYYINLDVFVKYQDESYTYWQAKEKVMRVDKKHYESYETISCLDKIFKVPNHYRDYLTEKYGDWSTPIKEWDCGEDEKTIIVDVG